MLIPIQTPVDSKYATGIKHEDLVDVLFQSWPMSRNGEIPNLEADQQVAVVISVFFFGPVVKVLKDLNRHVISSWIRSSSLSAALQ
jgi:hypothetical protein